MNRYLAGEVTAGEVTAGEVTAREVTAREVTVQHMVGSRIMRRMVFRTKHESSSFSTIELASILTRGARENIATDTKARLLHQSHHFVSLQNIGKRIVSAGISPNQKIMPERVEHPQKNECFPAPTEDFAKDTKT